MISAYIGIGCFFMTLAIIGFVGFKNADALESWVNRHFQKKL
jgi:hypothetical protein